MERLFELGFLPITSGDKRKKDDIDTTVTVTVHINKVIVLIPYFRIRVDGANVGDEEVFVNNIISRELEILESSPHNNAHREADTGVVSQYNDADCYWQKLEQPEENYGT